MAQQVSKDMRSLSLFFILLALFLFVNHSDARKDPGEYWKSVMNGEPMPKAIKDIFHQDPASSETINMGRFIKDFDTKPSNIIYHSHVDPKAVKPLAKEIELEEEN